MEIEVCPKCGGRHFRGTSCSCQQSGSVPVQRPKLRPTCPAKSARVKGLGSALAGVAILLGSVLVIGLVVYGISAQHLKHAPAEPVRSGTTSVEYAQVLDDKASAQALLDLISSRPGYDLYTITYPSPVGTVDAFGYKFSTDTIGYVYTLAGAPTPLYWEGHGIERLEREAQGGSLDD